jgi:cytoskeletal protein RodZ
MKVADSSTAMTQMGSTRPSPRKRRLLTDLAAIREAKGISLRQISEATKIGVRYLKAIEASQFEQLPGGLFNTSYIRQYARAIDYDEWELLASYGSTIPEPPPEAPPARGSLGTTLRVVALRLLPGKRG